MNPPVKEYRIVCHGSGQPGHQDHVFNYPTFEQASKMVERRTDEWARERTTQMCTPFHLEVRWISMWEEHTDGE